MKKLCYFIYIIAFATIFTFNLCSCKGEPSFDSGDIQATIYVATDTHLLSEELFSKGNEKYIKKNLTADGRIQEKDYELMEALVAQVNTDKPDALIFTGDLSFNGEKLSHEAFVSFLNQINSDVTVLVIPGNHDFNILECRSYYDDSPQSTSTINESTFRELYSPYGYGEALSCDTNSLSYICEVTDKVWAIMLDTTLCEFNEKEGLNTVGGVVWDETIDWLKPQLQYASENGITVIGFSHHNLTVHNPLFTNRFIMQNAEALLDLYEEYGVQLHFSGHMHIQNISQVGNVYDIAQGSLLDYGNQVGKLEVFDNCLKYTRRQIGSLEDYSLDVFVNDYLNRNSSSYLEKYGDQAEEVHLLASIVNAYYFDGDYIRVHETLKENPIAADLLRREESGSNSYLDTLLSVPEEDQNNLTIKITSEPATPLP